VVQTFGQNAFRMPSRGIVLDMSNQEETWGHIKDMLERLGNTRFVGGGGRVEGDLGLFA